MRPRKAPQWMHVLLPALLAARRPLGEAPARSLPGLAQRLGVSEAAAAPVVTPLQGEATGPGRGPGRRLVRPRAPPQQAACDSGKKQDPTGKPVR
jgi:hypothetical protein